MRGYVLAEGKRDVKGGTQRSRGQPGGSPVEVHITQHWGIAAGGHEYVHHGTWWCTGIGIKENPTCVTRKCTARGMQRASLPDHTVLIRSCKGLIVLPCGMDYK
ncbi:hypothetical protein NDU88_002512 [Pleurodeles waltl]|uniref:Uncharacterized protein n=1 Tax=Pleurodeles waltl TaxID=8319 RepID=A0AAV7U9Z1_PLEWA|nr:hypothetical protein NDU88_002512 [Pleurodeles waltl]